MNNDKMAKWTKLSAIGSILSGIAIIFLAIGIFQTNESVNLGKQTLIDTEKEQSLHLRPWVGVSQTNLYGVYLVNGSFLSGSQFFALQGKDPSIAEHLGIDHFQYSLTFKNSGSTPAENITLQFRWLGNDTSNQSDLNATFTHHSILMPDMETTYKENLAYDKYEDVWNGTLDEHYMYELDYIFNGGNGFLKTIGHISPNVMYIDNQTVG